MALTPVQNLKFASVKILQERIDQNEQQAKRAPTTTEQMFKAKDMGSSLKAEEKSTFDKIRSKIVGATVFDSSRITKGEFKARMLKEIASELEIDFDKKDTDFKHLADLIRDKLVKMKDKDPEGYKEFVKKINKRLGLDKMGLKAEDFAEVTLDPLSKKAEEVDRKLDVYFGKENEDTLRSNDGIDDVKEIMHENEDNPVDEKAADQLADASRPNEILTDQPTGTYMPRSFPPARA